MFGSVSKMDKSIKKKTVVTDDDKKPKPTLAPIGAKVSVLQGSTKN